MDLPRTQAISAAGPPGCSMRRLKSQLGCCGPRLMANSSESCWWPATRGTPWGLILQLVLLSVLSTNVGQRALPASSLLGGQDCPPKECGQTGQESQEISGAAKSLTWDGKAPVHAGEQAHLKAALQRKPWVDQVDKWVMHPCSKGG